MEQNSRTMKRVLIIYLFMDAVRYAINYALLMNIIGGKVLWSFDIEPISTLLIKWVLILLMIYRPVDKIGLSLYFLISAVLVYQCDVFGTVYGPESILSIFILPIIILYMIFKRTSGE